MNMLALTLGTNTFALVAMLLGLSFAVLAMAWGDSEDWVRVLRHFKFVDPSGFLQPIKRVLAKLVDYAVVPATDGSGTQFTTTGALGAVIFTLPAPTPQLAGYHYEFTNSVNQNMTVATTATKAITFNNAAATSLAASTAGQKIGAVIRAYCDGAAWHLQGSTVGVTYTVA